MNATSCSTLHVRAIRVHLYRHVLIDRCDAITFVEALA